MAFSYACQSNKNQDTSALLEEYFQPFPNIIQPLDPDLASQSVKEQAFKLYNIGKYDQARILFDELQLSLNDPEVDFYHGICLMKLNQPDEALKLFRGISKNVQFYDHARWYSALAYLQNGEIDKAKDLLKSISEKAGMVYNQEQAKKLLNRL